MYMVGLHCMHLCGMKGDTIVKLLCNAGAHVNAQTVRYVSGSRLPPRSTPLHMAVIKRNRRIVKTLISYEAELLKDKKGKTALDISIEQNSTDITEELDSYFKV